MSDESPVNPKAPELKNPVTARPTTTAAGTRTGLKTINSGVVTASPMTLPMSVKPASASSVPPTGRRTRIARTLVADGPLC